MQYFRCLTGQCHGRKSRRRLDGTVDHAFARLTVFPSRRSYANPREAVMGSKLFGARTKTGGDHALSVKVRSAGIASDLLRWDRGADRYPPGFYVYKLVDPRDQRVFYVGKGQRDRAWQHERRVAAGRIGSNKVKEDRIRAILADGCRVVVRIDAIYRLESDALEREFQLVDASPDLTNAMVGGVGPAATPEQIDRLRQLREAKRVAVRHREAMAAAERDLDKKEASFMAGAKTQAQRAEIARWVNSYRQGDGKLDLKVR